MDKFVEILRNKKSKVMVFGDFMLDHYLYGNVNRLSPEAPIPIVNYNKESYLVGRKCEACGIKAVTSDTILGYHYS